MKMPTLKYCCSQPKLPPDEKLKNKRTERAYKGEEFSGCTYAAAVAEPKLKLSP